MEENIIKAEHAPSSAGRDPPPPCPPDIKHVHVLFSVGVDDVYAKNGATVLLDDIQFTPVPADLANVISFPLGNQTFGVVPLQIGDPPPIAFPADQVLRNLTTTYESAITLIALLARAKNGDVADALEIANAFDYSLHNDNQGDRIPLASDGSAGLHNGYENGDLPLLNNQSPPGMGRAGNSRLAGFAATQECPATGFCLVLDGATGGNNAFAILALLAAFQRSKNTSYLNDSVEIGDWIVRNLTDSGSNGYGGYFLGYPDQGVPPKPLLTGKSTENNADIFAAFTALASVEAELGSAAAANWAAEANRAGDFVMAMFDSTKDRFNVGTVPAGTVSGPGICPTGTQKGNDVINTCDFLDTDTFTTLAMAGAPRYSSQIDWRQPIQYVLKTFAQSVSAAGRNYSGFNIVPTPVSGPNGVAWEFTGQTVAAMKYVDHLYAQTAFESSASFYLSQIRQAQKFAPFEDREGLVASTLAGGDQLSPLNQCLNTPFQCIAERSGLAATVWAIFADRSLNPFLFQAANAK